jgi:regulator of sigma E protease
MPVIAGILGVSLLIILHELGHYLVARACGMRVLRFSVGFGPALLQRQFGETTWQLALVPLGGFVQIDGMGPAFEGDEPPDERTFRQKPVWQRVLVIFAGPAINWLFAAFAFVMIAAVFGLAREGPGLPVIGEVIEGKPAAKAGLQEHDRVLSIDGVAINNWQDLVLQVEKNPERSIPFEIERDGLRQRIDVTPERVGGEDEAPAAAGAPATTTGGVGKIGVNPEEDLVRLGLGEAIVAGVVFTWRTTVRQAGMLLGMVVGTEQGELSGIPEIVKMVSAQAARGMRRLLQFLAWLSIGLFLFNLFPIPALDGGRLVFLVFELVTRRRANERVEAMVHTVGLLFLLGLIVLVTFRDVMQAT